MDDGDGCAARAAFVVDRVADRLIAAEISPHLEDPRDRSLACLLREFQTVLPRAARIADGGEFVHATQCRVVECSDQPGTHAPRRDRRTLLLETFDQSLVQVIRGENHRLVEAGFVENSAHLAAQVGEVAGIETDSQQLMPLAQPFARLDGMATPSSVS